MKTIFHRQGFTLVEMLVAMVVASVLLILLATLTQSAAETTTRVLGRLTGQEGAVAALDYLEADFAGITTPELARSTLTFVPELLQGRSGGTSEIPSFWIMLLSRPTAVDDQGAIRALSYRMTLTDPMVAGGSDQRLSLYRSNLTENIFTTAPYLDVADLHADFWASLWPAYEADNGGGTLLQDYLTEDLVEISITLEYMDALGDQQSWKLPDDAPTYWMPDGFTSASPSSSLALPNSPLSLTFKMTALRTKGAVLYRSGAISLSDAIREHGTTFRRSLPLLTR